MSFSLQETFRDRHILVTGCSGFVGKVWLALVLTRLPSVGKLYLLIRSTRKQKAFERFEALINDSPVFRPLHEQFGENLSRYIGERVEVLDGDITHSHLNLTPSVQKELYEKLDLIVHCAGLTDFEPDLRDAFTINVKGTLHILEFTRQCQKARLQHISTCYVAGTRPGRILESIHPQESPSRQVFTATQEFASIEEQIRLYETDPPFDQMSPEDRDAFPKENAKARERWLRKILAQEGMKRALSWGWPNTYTYTKSLAESLLFEKSTGVVFSIVRPSIVESAVQFPFPGWNEGFNTTGPLIYLVSTGYRDLPARPYHTLDLIPVDYLCNAMLLNAGALLRGEHQLIYQIGTSDRNPLYLERTAELTSLGHRKYLRKHGKTFAERFFLSRLNTRLRNEDSPFSVASFKKWTQGIEHLAADFFPLAWQEELQKVQEWKKGADRLLKFAEKIIETYKPYTYDVAQTFECRAIQAHIPQEAIFQCPIEALDWYRYFIDIHVPGLRKWCFPLLEGQAIEKYSPLYRFSYRPSSSSLSKLTPEEVL